MKVQFPVEKNRIQNQMKQCFRTETSLNFVLKPNFFLPGTNLSLKVQARMEDKVRIKNLISLFAILRNLVGYAAEPAIII